MTTHFKYVDGCTPDFTNPRDGLVSIEHNYGDIGWPNSDARIHCVDEYNSPLRNNTIYLNFENGKIHFSVNFEYFHTMYGTMIMCGKIMYENWSLPELLNRIKILADRIAPTIKEDDEDSESFLEYHLYADRVEEKTVIRKKTPSISELVSSLSDEEKQEIHDILTASRS